MRSLFVSLSRLARRSAAPILALAAIVLLAPTAIGQAGNTSRWNGNIYSQFGMISDDAVRCRTTCERESRCVAWTMVRSGAEGSGMPARCLLFDSVSGSREPGCCVSGGKGGVGAAPAPAAPVYPISGPSVEVLAVNGEVEVSPLGDDSQAYVLRPGMVIRESDRIVTSMDSSATIRFKDGHVVTIDELTDMKVASYSDAGNLVQTRLWLRGGRISAQLNKGSERLSDFAVKTPTATLGVRGTQFTVTHATGPTPTTTVEVTEGEVEVTPDNPSLPSYRVRAGGRVVITAVNTQASGAATRVSAAAPPPAAATAADMPTEWDIFCCRDGWSGVMSIARTERRGNLILFSGSLSASFAGGTINGRWNLDTGEFMFNRDLAGALSGQRQWFRGQVVNVGGRLAIQNGTWGGYNEGGAPNDWRAVAKGGGAPVASAPPPTTSAPPSGGGYPPRTASDVTLSLRWEGKGGDVVAGAERAMRDGVADGQFALDINAPSGAPVEKIELFTVDAAGQLCCGQIWSTRNPAYWLLGVSSPGGSLFNSGHMEGLTALPPGRTQMQLHANDSGWFKPGQAFLVIVTLVDGREARAMTALGAASPGPAALPTEWDIFCCRDGWSGVMSLSRTERRGNLVLFSGSLSASFVGGTINGQWNLDTGEFMFNRDLAGQRQWFRGQVVNVGGRLVIQNGTWGGYNEGGAPNDWRAVAKGGSAPPPTAGATTTAPGGGYQAQPLPGGGPPGSSATAPSSTGVFGLWRGQNGVEFEIVPDGDHLAWRAPSIGQTGLGYASGDRVTLNWNGPQGYGSMSGVLRGDRIDFEDGSWMTRVR